MHDELTFLKQWVSDNNDADIDRIDPSANIFQAGYLDSLGVFRFVMDVETEFNVAFSEADITDTRMSTLNGVVAMIRERSA